MHVTRLEEAPSYEAPNHHRMSCLRLQGKEAGPSTQMWMGMSQILPGGHTGLDPSAMEKLYLVLEGRLHVTGRTPDGQQQEQELGQWDSVRFAPGEARQLHNRSSRPAVVLLVMPTQESA